MSNPKAKVLSVDTVESDRVYEKQLDHHFGINKMTCDSESLSMTFVRIKPGHKARAHFHLNSELGQYIIKGKGKYHFYPGVEGEEESYDIYPGCFIYVPKGCIHVIENTGDEDIESIAAYGEANTGQATLKIYAESPIE